MSGRRLLDLLTALAVVAALAVSGRLVVREFFPGLGLEEDASVAPTRSVYEPGLAAELARTGWRSGPGNGAGVVAIVEFSDFQCPACRKTAAALDQLLREQPGRVDLVYRHFPIERVHPHAFKAAMAFECAREQGRAGAMHDTLFADQEEIGRRSWADFAHAAGVPDGGRFGACMRGDIASARVRADAHLSRELGLEGTPTLLVGDAVVSGGIGLDSLRALVRAARVR